MSTAKAEKNQTAKAKRNEKMFTFDEYKEKFSREEPSVPASDDPDDVAATLASETVAILRKGLKGDGSKE